MRIRRVIILGISVFAVAVAAISLVRTARSFYRLDFPLTWTETGLEVGVLPAGSTAERAGLKEGYLVVAVNGAAIEEVEDPLFVLAVGEEHLLRVLDLAGELQELPYRPPPPAVDPVYLTRSLVALLGLACAFWAFWATSRREATTFVLLAASALLLGAIPHRTAATGDLLRLLHRVAGTAMPFLLVRFFVIFPERQRRLRAWDALTVLALVASAVVALRPNLEAWWSAAIPALRVLFVVALLVGTGISVHRWWSAAREARIRRQIEWVALGMFVGLLPYTSLVLVPGWIGITFAPFSWLAVLPIVAVPLGFLAALTEYRLWDLEPITRDSVAATMVVVAGAFVFALTNHLLLSYGGALGALRNLFLFATGVLLVVLLQPLRVRVESFLDRWLHHGRPPPRALLTHSTHDLVSATDPRDLLVRLTEALHEGMEVDLVATYLRVGDGAFERVTGSGDEVPDRLPATVAEQTFPHHQEEHALHLSGYAERILLERVTTVHGLLYLGLRRGLLPLGSEAHEVLAAFVAQAALALENARQLDELRRQAEEYRILHANTQRIIESSAAAILVCDAGGRILSVNTQAADIFGQTRRSLVGEPLSSLVEVPDRWSPQLPLHAVNAETRTRSEPMRRLIVAVSVLELDSGSFNGRVVVLQDVTEMRELQDRLREQERLASLGRLASGLAHEINTPLTGIASFAQMLGEMTPAEDPRARLVGKLVDQSFRVSRIVANLREAIRGSRASGSVLDMHEVATRAARDAARSLGASERLELAQPGHPVMVWGAEGPVELAVGNLVRNAVEAAPAGSTVRIEIVPDGSWGEVRVDDRGPGVPEELQERVFEPFFTTKTERGGTGLGLSISRDMISQLGGQLVLANRPGGGTRAMIKLPLWEAPAQSS